MHEAVFGERMHGAGLGLARLEEAQRLGDRHLEHQDLVVAERRLRNPVAGLDDRRLGGAGRRGDAGGLLEEFADRDRIGGVVRALVDHFQHVVGAEDRGGDLHAAGAPAIGHRHLARGEGGLVAGNRDRLQDRAADHPLGLLVEIGEIIAGNRRIGHGAASASGSDWLAAAAARCSARKVLTRPSSLWKST